MFGAIAIIIVLLLIPVGILLSGGVVAAVLGGSLQHDGELRADGSELAGLDD